MCGVIWKTGLGTERTVWTDGGSMGTVQSELEGVTKIYSNSYAFLAVIVLDQKPGVTYPKGCFVWSPSIQSDAIPTLLVYSNPTVRPGNCRSYATCICAAESCQSRYRSTRSLRVERPGSYDVHVKYENGNSCVHQLEQIVCNNDKNYVEVNGMCRIKPTDIQEVPPSSTTITIDCG